MNKLACQDDKLLAPQYHHLALELRAASALRSQDYVTAFRLADRRCRIDPEAQSHCYVLRAEAAYHLGAPERARADLETAIAHKPDNLAANRRLLAWGDSAERLGAAKRLLARDTNVSVLRTALSVLGQEGRVQHARVDVYDSRLSGWVAWDQEGTVEITIRSEDSTSSAILAADPFHPLSSEKIRATGFDLVRAPCTTPQTVTLSAVGTTFHSRRVAPNRGVSALRQSSEQASPPTVIVPIYADVDATTACFKSLLADYDKTRDYRIILINDASPERGINELLGSLAKRPGVTILTNPFNIGFVGTVNRALSIVNNGDVVLLNSDTIVPPGFVTRLAHAAHASSDIGTVVPLSNNGEFSSFPLIYASNNLPDHDQLRILDRIASSANADTVIDLPAGTGFCMYITRACLDATGYLYEGFERGYLEDVDFCLRARERGFRSVCAPSVFVGHAGSRSFAADKRALVLRNLEVLARKFPAYTKECRAFLAIDPLRTARAAIERTVPSPSLHATLVLTSTGVIGDISDARVAWLTEQGTPALTLLVERGGSHLALRGSNGAIPQSLTFDLDDAAQREALHDYLEIVHPSRCEVFAAAALTQSLSSVLDSLKIPQNIWIVDDRSLAAIQDDSYLKVELPREAGRPSLPRARSLSSIRPTPRRSLTAPTILAQSYLVHQQGDLPVTLGNVAQPTPLQSTRASRPTGRKTLTIVPATASAAEYELIKAIALAMNDRLPEIQLVVLGTTLDDLALIAIGNVFVTGPIASSEFGDALLPYDLGWVLTGFGRPLFGHPSTEAARQSTCPVAYLDWSFGRLTPRAHDLAINPALSIDQVASILITWIGP